MTEILKLIVEIDHSFKLRGVVNRILQDDTRRDPRPQVYVLLKDKLQLLSKTLTRITAFQNENKAYKQEMCFRGKEAREMFVFLGRAIFGYQYFKDRDCTGGTLLVDGSLLEEQTERQLQITEFHDYCRASNQKVGHLQVPDLGHIPLPPPTEKTPEEKKYKTLKALEKMPPKTVFEEVPRPAHRPITPLSPRQQQEERSVQSLVMGSSRGGPAASKLRPFAFDKLAQKLRNLDYPQTFATILKSGFGQQSNQDHTELTQLQVIINKPDLDDQPPVIVPTKEESVALPETT